MNIKKEIEKMLESCRLSSRPRFYKIGLREIRQLEELFWEWHKEIELANKDMIKTSKVASK